MEPSEKEAVQNSGCEMRKKERGQIRKAAEHFCNKDIWMLHIGLAPWPLDVFSHT